MTKARKSKKPKPPQGLDRPALSKELSRMTKEFTKQVTEVAEKAGVKIGVKVLIAESSSPASEGEANGSV